MARKRKKPAWVMDFTRLDECNHTELVQLARAVGHESATRQDPPEELIETILGEDFEIEDPLGEIREKTFDYVKGNSLMLSTLDCSAYCPTCPHERVLNCFAINSDLILPPHENPLT